MSNTKSPLEQALLEGQEIMKVARENAKEMLASQLQPEIDKIVKESISEAKAEDKKEEVVAETKVEETVKEDLDMDVEKPADDVVISNDEILTGGEDKEDEKSDDEVNVVDMTSATDDETVKVFKKMDDGDEIEVVKDGDNINIKDGDDEYIVKVNEGEESEDDIIYELDLSNYMDDEESEDVNNEEVIYEIEIDDNEVDEIARTHADGRSTRLKGDQFYKYAKDRTRDGDIENHIDEVSLEELARDHANGRTQKFKSHQFYVNNVTRERNGDPRQKFVGASDSDTKLGESEIKNLNESIKLKDTELKTIKEENESLKADLNKHKEALRTLRENITEVAVLNSNLAYANRLFCEHSTTNDEKINIVKRFDAVKTVEESKSLYKMISEEFKNGKTNIEESIENKINKTVSPASSVITESVNKEDEQVKRIKQLMSYSNKNR